MSFEAFTDEQARVAVNVAQSYVGWIEAERLLATLPYNLQIRTINSTRYLYEISDRRGNGRSLGRVDDEGQARFDDYQEDKAAAKAQRDGGREILETNCRLYRTLRLPMLPADAGTILREADRQGMLDGEIMVVGTNALPAYALEAAGFIRDAPDETQDFDLAWTKPPPATSVARLWEMLKTVDASFTVNSERPFQARNRKAYEVEVLVAPSRVDGIATQDKPTPVSLPEQEWLLMGRPVDHVVGCRDASPARLVVPDPRYFALHKLWMAEKPSRNPLKRPKDARQGMALLDAVAGAMPQFPLDEAFRDEVPPEVKKHYDQWLAQAPTQARRAW